MADWVLDAVSKIARDAAREGACGAGATESGTPIVVIRSRSERVAFVFDFMLLFSTQSGSDSYEHYVFDGTARVSGAELVDVVTAKRLARSLSEHAVEWADPPYDRRAVVEAISGEG